MLDIETMRIGNQYSYVNNAGLVYTNRTFLGMMKIDSKTMLFFRDQRGNITRQNLSYLSNIDDSGAMPDAVVSSRNGLIQWGAWMLQAIRDEYDVTPVKTEESNEPNTT